MMSRLWNRSSPQACQENSSELSNQSAIPIKMLPKSQKKRKFCAPYCFQYSGVQAISHTVQRIFSKAGMRLVGYSQQPVEVTFVHCPARIKRRSPSIPGHGAARNRQGANYCRNLMTLTPVPRMTMVWVIELSFSVPTKKPRTP